MKGESVIVYAPTIASVEETVDFLADNGIPAVPYHGQMDTGTRRRNQERWMNDEVRVLVGTVAFGLGINKPAVRAVIHLSLPKSIEQYYQEAGRAGRDGLPADCVLLWQPKDVGLLAFFIEKLQDAAEKQRAWQRYHDDPRLRRGRHAAATCQICTHFGQTPKWERCEMCDVCGSQPEWLTAAPTRLWRCKKKRKPKGRPRAGSPCRASDAPPRREPPERRVAPRSTTPPRRSTRELRRRIFKEWRSRRGAARVGAGICRAERRRFRRSLPQAAGESARIAGSYRAFGERKAELYGSEIFAAFEAYRQGRESGGQRGGAGVSGRRDYPPAGGRQDLRGDRRRFAGGKLATVVNMVADLVEKGRLEYRWSGWGRRATPGSKRRSAGSGRNGSSRCGKRCRRRSPTSRSGWWWHGCGARQRRRDAAAQGAMPCTQMNISSS